MSHYQKPPELYDGLRLHQNENTGGCSPTVIEALAKLRPDQIGFYPPYAETVDACARYLGVPPAEVALTNGLDEGIMGMAVACLRPSLLTGSSCTRTRGDMRASAAPSSGTAITASGRPPGRSLMPRTPSRTRAYQEPPA